MDALFSEVFFCKSFSHEPNQQALRRIVMILIQTKYEMQKDDQDWVN